MKYLECVVNGMRKRVRWSRTLWLVIISVTAILGVTLWITLYFYPQYNELWVLFLYTIPAEFLIAIVPQEPMVIYFGKLYHPFTVTWVTLIGTVLTEYLNYMLVTLFFKIPRLDDLKKRKTFQKAIHYFLLVPFVSLVIAAITPVPFYPFRIIAAVSRYSVKKYLLAIILGRTPRFYTLAYFGHIVVLPNKIIALLFVFLFTLIVISWFRQETKNKKL